MAHLAPIGASVADAVAQLAAELPGLGRVTLRRLTRHCKHRLDAIVRFLAVLELFKQGTVELDQAHWLGDIEIEWVRAGDPALVVAGIDEYEG